MEYIASDDILRRARNTALQQLEQITKERDTAMQELQTLRREKDIITREVESLRNDLQWMNTEHKSGFEELFETGAVSDFCVLAGPSKVAFKVHKVIICLESGYFRKCCSSTWKEGSEGMCELEDVTEEDMEIILLYCYRGLRLPMQHYDIFQLKRLMVAADYLLMPKLKEQIGAKIINLARAALTEDISGTRDFELGKDCMKGVMENYIYFREMMDRGEDSWSEDIEGLIRQVRFEGMVELLDDEEVRAFMEDNGGFGLWLWDIFISQALKLQ